MGKRRPSKKKRKMRKGFKVFMLLILVITAVVVLMLSPFFNLTSIEVEGNSKVSSEAIIAASGLTVGENTFRQNLKNVEKSVYAMPYIDTVDVKRKFPDKIRIAVSEGEIAAYVATVDKLIAIDNKGKTLELLPLESEIDKPIFAGAELDEVVLGQKLPAKSEKTLDTIIKYIGYLKEYDLTMVRTVNVANIHDVSFILKEGLKVYVGDDDAIGYKIAYLKVILSNIGETAKGTVDIRHPENGAPRREEQSEPSPSPSAAPSGSSAPSVTNAPTPTKQP